MDDAVRIAFESGRTYTGLRDFEIDARLWHYVPRAWAQREGVVPVLLVGDTLKLAASSADPDLTLLRTRFPNLELEIVIASPHEINEALAKSGQDV